MNQILYTGGKNKKRGINDTQKIVIFFVIFIIVFAICAIGIGTNLLNKVKNEGNNTTSNTVPQEPIEPAEPKTEIGFEAQPGGVKLIVTSDINIANISYWWDEDAPISIGVNNIKYETIISPKQGMHTLYVEVIDEDGNKKTAEQTVIGDAEPELVITTDGVSNYVIKAKDDEKVDKIVIVLNGETQEVEVNAKEFEYKVPIPQGYSLIDVTVYNLNGVSINKKAKITNFGG